MWRRYPLNRPTYSTFTSSSHLHNHNSLSRINLLHYPPKPQTPSAQHTPTLKHCHSAPLKYICSLFAGSIIIHTYKLWFLEVFPYWQTLTNRSDLRPAHAANHLKIMCELCASPVTVINDITLNTFILCQHAGFGYESVHNLHTPQSPEDGTTTNSYSTHALHHRIQWDWKTNSEGWFFLACGCGCFVCENFVNIACVCLWVWLKWCFCSRFIMLIIQWNSNMSFLCHLLLILYYMYICVYSWFRLVLALRLGDGCG